LGSVVFAFEGDDDKQAKAAFLRQTPAATLVLDAFLLRLSGGGGGGER